MTFQGLRRFLRFDVIAILAILLGLTAQRAKPLWFLFTSGQPGSQLLNSNGLFQVSAEDVRLGSRSAQLAIIEFSDFECPFCGVFARTTFPQIDLAMIRSGLVQYVFVNFPNSRTHPRAVQAASAALCAGQQNAFWDLHHLMFARQDLLSDTDLHSYISRTQADTSTFRKCLSSDAALLLKRDLGAGQRLKVSVTPTFFVGTITSDGAISIRSRLEGAHSIDMFQSVVHQILQSK